MTPAEVREVVADLVVRKERGVTLKRMVEVPRTERVEFVRVGQIERVTPSPSLAGQGLILRVKDGASALVMSHRCVVSSDSAGDHIRPGVLMFRGHGGDGAVFEGASGVEVAGDWLWVECPSQQAADLAETMRRLAPLSPQWPRIGDVICR